MGFMDLIPVNLHAQPRRIRYGNLAIDDFQRIFRQAGFPFLPNPVGVDGGRVTRRRRANVGKHRQRNIKVVVRVTAPGQPPVIAQLRHAHCT